MSELKILSTPVMRRVAFEISRDKKKTFSLFVILLVAAVMLVRLIARNPGSASATTSDQVTEHLTEDTSETTLELTVLSRLPAQRKAITTEKRISRDVFLFEKAYYPPAETDESGSADSKSPSNSRTRVQIVTQQARASLTLQSTFVSGTPTVVINGSVLQVGDWIEGFRIAAITSKTCEVEKEIDGKMIRVPLGMD